MRVRSRFLEKAIKECRWHTLKPIKVTILGKNLLGVAGGIKKTTVRELVSNWQIYNLRTQVHYVCIPKGENPIVQNS